MPAPKLPKGAQGAQDASPTAIAQAAGVSRQVVYRVQDDPAKAEAMLAEWGCSQRASIGAAKRKLGTNVQWDLQRAPHLDQLG